jgi:hypothetical protein
MGLVEKRRQSITDTSRLIEDDKGGKFMERRKMKIERVRVEHNINKSWLITPNGNDEASHIEHLMKALRYIYSSIGSSLSSSDDSAENSEKANMPYRRADCTMAYYEW